MGAAEADVVPLGFADALAVAPGMAIDGHLAHDGLFLVVGVWWVSQVFTRYCLVNAETGSCW